MDDTPAPLYHCAGKSCEDEIGQPGNHFWKCHLKAYRARGVPLVCRKCFFDLKFERITRNLPTRWDREIERLGLTGQERAWSQSNDLRRWAAKHANSCFVPERLLSTWRIPVTLDL